MSLVDCVAAVSAHVASAWLASADPHLLDMCQEEGLAVVVCRTAQDLRITCITAAGGLPHGFNGERLDSMMTGMTTTKIAVSLPAGLVEQAQRAVAEGRSSSVSAYVARALEEQTKLDDLASLLEEMLAETGGSLTPAERKTADRALGR